MSHTDRFLKKAQKINFRNYFARIQTGENYSRIIQWSRIISITGGVQILVQIIGFCSGILVIRLLPVEEYAYYTLANTMLGTMTLLADGGITAGVLSQGGKVWRDKSKLGAVLATGLDLRRKFAIGSILISFPILIYLLIHHEASWLMAALIAVSLIPAFYAQLSSALLTIVPKIHQEIIPIQKNDIGVGIGRLVLTAGLLFIFPFTFLALLASGLPRIYGNIQLKKIAKPFVTKQEPDPEINKNILGTVKRMMPGVIYYCVSGQITIWLISIFGNTGSLAQLGALARLAVMLALINKLINILIVPRFARLVEQKKLLLTYYVQIMAGVGILMLLATALVYFFSDQILWIIGEKYANLHLELVLVIIGGCLRLMVGTAFELNISRNWVMNPAISVTLSIVSIIVGALIFDITTLKGVLVLNIFLALIQFIINSWYGLFQIKQLPIKPV